MARVTIERIATEMGLSTYSVSRSLADKSGVSESTRQRVKAVAEALGYAPPTTRTSRRSVIGLVFHDLDLVNSELHLLTQVGVEAECERSGYVVSVFRAHGDALQIRRTLEGCAAAILVGPFDTSEMAAVQTLDIPIVRMGWLDSLERADLVSGTDHEAATAVGEYLIANGHRSIAYVHGGSGYRGRIERYRGIRKVIEDQDDIEFNALHFETDSGFSDALDALHAKGIKPSAFFCAHDGLAVTATTELMHRGLRIPQDVSVVGFGDYVSAMQLRPRLSTVIVNGEEMGAACVRLLDDRLQKRIDPRFSIRVQVTNTLVIRDSSGPYRKRRRYGVKSRSS